MLESSFLLAETVTGTSGKHFIKTDLVVAGGNLFFSSWKPFSSLPQIPFKKFFIPASGNTIFSPEEKVFSLKLFFPAGGNHQINYREAYSKLSSLLLATILFDFSDISANVSRFFV